jgi:tetratricopeptide (TPR) repeat protein
MRHSAASLVFFCAALTAAAWSPDALQKGLVLLQQNRPTEALEQLTLAEKQDPRSPRIRNFRGIALTQVGRYEEAAAEYHEAIRLDPRLADAYRNLGYVEWSRHHLKEAEQALRSSLQLTPIDPRAQYYLGRVMLDQQNYAGGLDALEKAQALWPHDVGFLLQVVRAYLEVGRGRNARQVLARTRGLPLTETQQVQCGALWVAAHDKATGLDVFESLARKHTHEQWAVVDLALAQLSADRPGEALATARSVPEPRRSSSLWTIIGIASARTGDHGRAVDAFRMAATLAPFQEERWMDLTRELMGRGQYVDAVAVAREAVGHLPHSYALRLRLGAAHMKAGQYKEAEGIFRDLVAQGDPQTTSAVGLAQTLLREARPEEALRALVDAERRLGRTFLLSYFQGIALDRAGKPEEAIARFQDAVQLNPSSADAYRWLGKAELRAGRVEQAIADLKQALRLDPSSQPARRLLTQAYAIKKPPVEETLLATGVEPEEMPQSMGEEAADFLVPAWELPPRAQ